MATTHSNPILQRVQRLSHNPMAGAGQSSSSLAQLKRSSTFLLNYHKNGPLACHTRRRNSHRQIVNMMHRQRILTAYQRMRPSHPQYISATITPPSVHLPCCATFKAVQPATEPISKIRQHSNISSQYPQPFSMSHLPLHVGSWFPFPVLLSTSKARSNALKRRIS